jgi:hypothetical protein
LGFISGDDKGDMDKLRLMINYSSIYTKQLYTAVFKFM